MVKNTDFRARLPGFGLGLYLLALELKAVLWTERLHHPRIHLFEAVIPYIMVFGGGAFGD